MLPLFVQKAKGKRKKAKEKKAKGNLDIPYRFLEIFSLKRTLIIKIKMKIKINKK